MKMLRTWLQTMKRKWEYRNVIHSDEDFEILDFDHTPYIDETLKGGHESSKS